MNPMQSSASESQHPFDQYYASQDFQTNNVVNNMDNSPSYLTEEELYGEYDRQVMAAALAADYCDASLGYYKENADAVDDDTCYDDVDDEMMEMTESYNEASDVEEYNYEEDSLLHLIVGVQSYLSDMKMTDADRQNSPLLDLQYKMYTYLKQRACDMGVDTANLY